MTIIWAATALTNYGWQDNVRVTLDQEGKISAIQNDSDPQGYRVGVLLPAPVNAHSHAFQRAMAGLTENRGPEINDSFWTWRQAMFMFLSHLTPDQVEAIAAYVQMEMLEAGYASSVEFHYLHHDQHGRPYKNLAEMSERILTAAEQTGIGMTLLPVLYQQGGCDGRSLGAGQRRFGNDLDRFLRLFGDAKTALTHLPADAKIGVAAHSLRAVSREALMSLAAFSKEMPIHLHLAEQEAEVDEVQTAYGRRPVEWLLDNVEIDKRWCLIHCTQMQPEETIELARTGAVAGLCPITESNLGDGVFDAVRWLGHDGRIAIGSDSHIRISLSEELRLLEYSQRLQHRSRAALATTEKSTGRRLFDAVNTGGAQSANRDAGRIEEGAWADLLALDDQAVDLTGRHSDRLLDSYVFAGDDGMVTDVWSAGRHKVRDGRHVAREAITERYRQVIKTLVDAL
ncbi:MAG: formimidoylglutamate deiminase [Geminicoccales bacterium]